MAQEAEGGGRRRPWRPQGKTALHLAAERGHTAAVEALLGAGADPGVRETIGCTALHRACETPHPSTAAALLAAGCPPDIPDLEGATPLHYTFQSPEDASGKEADREATVASLLAAKADVRAVDQNGATALHYAAIVACTGAVVKLLQGGADVRLVSASLSFS